MSDPSMDNEVEEQASTDGVARAAENGVKLADDDRVVMRHRIALNLNDFRATPVDFEVRPQTQQPELPLVKRPLLSIVIPNYNGIRYLPALLEALEHQTLHDIEVVLVDDASSDRSVEWTEEHHPTVRVIVNRYNEGFAKSCNTGAAASRGRIIVMLNSDTQPDQDWAEALALAACREPSASIFASKVLLFDRPDTLHTTGDGMGVDGVPKNRGVWERDLGQYDDRLEVFGGSGCALAIRRELWDALGGFDEDFWMYLEDVDFAYRAQLMGARVVFVPQARVLHHLTATAGGTMSSYFVGRNTIWMIAKNTPLRILMENWFSVLAAQTRIAADAIRHIRGTEARARLRGQAVGVLSLGRILSKRRSVQARRRLDDVTLRKRLYG